MGDLYHNSPFDRYEVQERKMLRLQQEIAAMEEKLDENVALRRQLENQELTEHERTQRVIDKMNSRNMLLKEEIDRFNSSRSPVNSPPPKKLVSDIMSQRTKEFSIQQHEKALHYKHLMAEKQRLQLAQDKLREKRLALHRLPTANGKMTRRYWGQKYDVYTPLSYNSYFEVYSPVFEEGYYTYFPREALWLKDRYPEERYWRRKARKERNVLYVPRPLYRSTYW